MEFSPKENLIMFSFDLKRKDLFETFGGTYPSPNLTRFAQQGVLFNNMYAAAPSTIMSLRTILNGQNSHDFDMYSPTPKRFDGNLFSKFKKRGYRTFFIMSRTLADEYANSIHSPFDAERIIIPDECFSSTALAREIIKISKECKQPFFIFAHSVPYVPCDESLKPSWRNAMERYIHEDDLAVGLLLDNVNLQNTRLMVYADHGVALGEHYNIFRHAYFVFNTILSVPCIVSNDHSCVVNDICTLPQLHFLALNNEITKLSHIYAHSQYAWQMHRVSMVREGDWKYVAHYSPHTAVTGLQEELYDLASDVGEYRNLLYDISRHPLRYGFNISSNALRSGVFSYDRNLIRDKLRSLRAEIAKIWSINMLNHIYMKFPEQYQNLKEKLNIASDFEKITVMGNLAKALNPNMPNYGRKEPKLPDHISIPFGFPTIPKSSSNLNFSLIDSEQENNISTPQQTNTNNYRNSNLIGATKASESSPL
jgi:hypothetical protein